MTITTRRATPEDIDWLLPQLRAFSAFFGTKADLFGDESHAREAMISMILNHHVWIAEKLNIGPLGFIAGVLTPHMFNPQIKVFAETFWWVDERHRGTRAGLLLLDQFLDYGKKNADWITFALETKSPVADKALTRRGFHLQERSFLMEVS